MSMQDDLDNERILSPEEEERFGRCLRRVLITDRPNPTRKGCPDPTVIRDIAFHRWKGEPKDFERVASHLADCSPCARQAMIDVEEYREERRVRRRRLMALGTAAIVVLAVALWAVFRQPQKQDTVDKSKSAPTQQSGAPAIADAGNQERIQPAAPTLESLTIEIPSTWRGPSRPAPPIVIPRGHLSLEIHLPVASPEGQYKLRILDTAGKVRAAIIGTAHTSPHGLTGMKVTVDTSTLPSGNYALSLLQPGLDEWSDYPARIE